MTEPAGHHGPPGHRADRAPKPGWRQPRYVAAAAVVVGLIAAGGVYATTQAGLPGGSSAGAGPAGTAVGSPLTVPSLTASPASSAAQATGLPGTAPASSQTSPAATAEAAPKPADVPAAAAAVPAIGPELDAQINAIIKANSA